MSDLDLGREYKDFLNSIKAKVRNAQIRASLAVNEQLLRLYWSIGKDILAKQALLCWGSGVIDQLSADLTSHFPGQRGFSPRNLRAIRRFAETWPEESIWQQPVAKLPWSHNLILIEKLKSNSERLWYAEQSVLNGWSRSVLVHQIESGLIERQGKAPNNFSSTLPSTESDLAVAMLKDPLNLSFLEMTEFAHERHLERALVDNIKKFLIALGAGFAFMGEQVRVEVGEQEFYTDLLFYHTKLHCYVVIDLKTGEFTPEHQGKMQFYVNVVDAKMRDSAVDNPTIGIILCKSKHKDVVEFALKGSSVPVGVASYTLSRHDKDALALDALKKHLVETDLEGS